MIRLLVVVWLLQRALCVALAARTMQSNEQRNTEHLRLGSLLNIATWNCGGLSYTTREFCAELGYDILALTETHNQGTLPSNNQFIVSEPAPVNDSYAGTALLLSNRVAKCVIHKGHHGSRICYVRIRSQPCNLFVISIYVPHKFRKCAPFANDTLTQLEQILAKVKSTDCIMVLGDFNCKLARNVPNLTGRWSVHNQSNKVGEDLLDIMRRHKLFAISTFFQPPRNKTNVTYLPRDKTYKPSQLDYVLISSRWATAVRNSQVKWGASCQRWGRRYDHGLVSCTFVSRVRSDKPTDNFDFSLLRTNEASRSKFEQQMASNYSSASYNENDSASASFERLRLAVQASAKETLPLRKPAPIRKRYVSARTRDLYANRQAKYEQMTQAERKAINKNITSSCRDDYREYIDSMLGDMEAAERVGNMREVTRIIKSLRGRNSFSTVMPSKDLNGDPITSAEQLLKSWNQFLADKFSSPDCDLDRPREHTVSNEDSLSDEELDKALFSMKAGKAPGWDDIPVEVYQNSTTARAELYRIIRIIFDTELVPPEFVRGVFIMIYKKKDRDNFANYRAICLLCHAYKLLSTVLARRLHIDLAEVLPDTQAGFRPSRGTRDNICILKWTIKMILRENREAVVTFIDYSAAFDSESQLFLDEALKEAGVSTKIRRIIQGIFHVAAGYVRQRKADGTFWQSDMFDIARGVLQGDVFSAVAFIIGLWLIFKRHDLPNRGVSVGTPPYQVNIENLEYADDAGLVDNIVADSSNRLTSITNGSSSDAAMSVSMDKTKAMPIHKEVAVSETQEDEVVAMKFKHKCAKCSRSFPTIGGLRVHSSRFCDKRRRPRSRKGTLADKAVQLAKRKHEQSQRPQVIINGHAIENVYFFVYLGSLLQCDGDDLADVAHRMQIAQAVFSELSHIWSDHRLPQSMKLRLYILAVCSTLAHACEAWVMTPEVCRKLNGFNSRCLHVITKKHYRETATDPVFNLLLSIRKRRLRFLGHVLRMSNTRLLKKTLFAYVHGGADVPAGSLMMDCEGLSLRDLEDLAHDRAQWKSMVDNLR